MRPICSPHGRRVDCGLFASQPFAKNDHDVRTSGRGAARRVCRVRRVEIRAVVAAAAAAAAAAAKTTPVRVISG